MAAQKTPRSPSGTRTITSPLDYALVQHYANLLERYDLLFKATNDVVYDLDLTNSTVQWNEALYTHYGYQKHKRINTIAWWTSRIHPEDALKLEAAFATFLDSAATHWEQEYRFRRADGTYLAIRDRGLVMRDAQGRAVRIIGSFLDITKQRQLNRAKDEFISLASHQLKTPLSIIRTYGEMLTEGMLGPLTPSQQEHAARITAASVRLVRMVDSILNVSRFELNELQVARTNLDLAACVETAVTEVIEHAHLRGVRVTFRRPAHPCPLYADGLMLDQIINNLLINAINYSPANKGQVHIHLKTQRDCYLIRIRDNGIGIPESDKDQVFSRFYRGSNAIDTTEQGSGLGLYLVRMLTEALGGMVWFEKNASAGTTFYVRLPVN